MCEQGDLLQERLKTHFAALDRVRRRNRVVFALEHGLSSDDIAQVRAVISSGSGAESERARHSLLWIVHSAEVAYDYEGDEYWQSFGRRTPGWDDRLRPWIRELFQHFAGEYGGPQPTGLWARAFGIIAWPITNAILPTDLQRHLARALYQSRAGLAKRLDDVGDLGRFVAASGWEGSDRYNQLREQPLLLGQIALALLRPQHLTDELLLEPTLRRIAADLETKRSAASWLRAARNTVERAHVRLEGPRHTSEGTASSVEERVRSAARMTSPRLVLRPDRLSPGSWAVWLQLPDLSPIAAVDISVREDLRNSQCWAPACDTPIARGMLLRGDQELKVARWPEPNAPLVRFQGLAAGLESALMNEWCAPELPALFGVRVDESAAYIASRVVRPGRRYVVARKERLAGWARCVATTRCVGALLYAINIPSAIPPDLPRRLPELGIKLTRTSRVWPAGIVPVEWDGEASAQWLAGDMPVLGISPDHDLHKLVIDLGNGAVATQSNIKAGTALFAILPRWQVGFHQVTIREEPTDGPAPPARIVAVTVREPRTTSAGDGPVRMWVEPYSRDLADIWDGVSAVNVGGLPGTARLSVALAPYPRVAPETVLQETVAIPMDSGAWRSFISRLTADETLAARYDDSRWGTVQVDAGRFGVYSIEFERLLPPLRWRLNGEGPYTLMLANDTDSLLDSRIIVGSFARPNDWASVNMARAGATEIADPKAGLYVARLESNVAAVIVPPPRILKSWSELRLDPEVATVPRSAAAIAGLLEDLGLWAGAPLPGNPLARAWRARVVRSLHRQVILTICGARWCAAEETLSRDRSEGAWVALRSELSSASPMALKDARMISDAASAMVDWPPGRRIELFMELARNSGLQASHTWSTIVARKGPRAREWVAELWLRLATDVGCRLWIGSLDREALEFVLEWPLPVRVARCVALRTAVGTTDPQEFPPLVERWSWR
jgi:hypothetical protein